MIYCNMQIYKSYKCIAPQHEGEGIVLAKWKHSDTWEYGLAAWMAILGIEILNEGGGLSVDDFFIK